MIIEPLSVAARRGLFLLRDGKERRAVQDAGGNLMDVDVGAVNLVKGPFRFRSRTRVVITKSGRPGFVGAVFAVSDDDDISIAYRERRECDSLSTGRCGSDARTGDQVGG